MQAQEDYSRRMNLKIDGVIEPDQESKSDLKATIYNFFSTHLNIQNASDIKLNDFHRIGAKSRGKRTIIVQFNWKEDRDKIWQAKSKLSGKTYYISEHYCETTENNRKVIYPYVQSARIAKVKHSFFKDKLKIDGKIYTKTNIYDVPEGIQPQNTATKTSENTVIFHSKESYLSNWYNAPFSEHNQHYEHTEQYYFSKLADHFGDDATAEKIRNEKDPRTCKTLGRRIIGYKHEQAEKIARKLMLDANMHKFDQHENLADMLIATEEKNWGKQQKAKCGE